MSLKEWVKKNRLVAPVVRRLYYMFAALKFRGSADYWEQRYRLGGNSGAGSYNRLARFKADFLNEFVTGHDIRSVVEFGCGDGAQLLLAQYPRYLGLDVARTAVLQCRKRFANDANKCFELIGQEPGRHDLALSLDVIYHLIEDETFDNYMNSLFGSADRFVIVYSSNTSVQPPEPHVRHRLFTEWVGKNRADWGLQSVIPNKYPFNPLDPDNTSFADFYVFARSGG